MTTTSGAVELAHVSVPGTATTIQATLVDGQPYVALRPACEALGIDFATQFRKVKSRSWATTVEMTMVAADGKLRAMTMVDRRTLTMWLATLSENKVDPNIRGTVVAFQREAADALDAYFHEGGAVNPGATAEQLGRLIEDATAQAGLLQNLKGIVDATYLEAKGRLLIARAFGETPALDPGLMPLYVKDYLAEVRKLTTAQIKSVQGTFGKAVKARFIEVRGREPESAPVTTADGRIRTALAYTQSDRPLFDEVWADLYADKFPAV